MFRGNDGEMEEGEGGRRMIGGKKEFFEERGRRIEEVEGNRRERGRI